jgi:hypothetical protein
VFRADHDSIDQIDTLKSRVKEGVSRLKGLDMGDVLSIEILSQLVDGRKSTAEIVELVYGLRKGDRGFKSCYSRTARAIRVLESRGLVSRRLLGRDKPYRLTPMAIANLARIGGEEQQMALVPKADLVAYVGTLSLAVPFAMQAVGLVTMSGGIELWLFPCFCFMLGICFVEVLRTFRRVF